jgi:hypothetical protein
VIAEICQSTGWTWDCVEETMTMRRFLAFQRVWRKTPPVHVLVAGLSGYKAPAGTASTPAPALPEYEP